MQDFISMKPIDLLDDALSFQRFIQNHELLFVLQGSLAENDCDEQLSLLESKVDEITDNRMFKKRLFNVLVECAQNIHRHGKCEAPACAMLVLGKNEKGYYVLTSNPIGNDCVDTLTEKLDEVKRMSVDEMRDAFRTKLSCNDYGDKGGAGLGFLDIARKSKGDLEYQIQRLNEDYSYFTLKVNICPTKEVAQVSAIVKLSLTTPFG